MFPSQFANIFLTYQTFVTHLHQLRVELRCKLQEKLHRVTGPLGGGVVQVRCESGRDEGVVYVSCGGGVR